MKNLYNVNIKDNGEIIEWMWRAHHQGQ